MTTPPRRPSPAARATRRSRRPAAQRAPFLERNRQRVLWGVAGLAFVLLAGMAFLNVTRPTYACTSIWAPTTAPSYVPPTAVPVESGATPAPIATPPAPGYVQPDMGHIHAPTGETVRYAFCPPASGRHYNASGQGPIEAGLYGPEDQAVPPGWVHNLEHGALVLLYKCPSDACTTEGQARLQDLLERWPDSPICKIEPGRLTPLFARFDDMAWNYAAIVWDVILPMDQLDEPLLLDFYARNGEQFNQEKQCADPTPSPGPTPTPGPATPSPAPGSPAASPAGSPASPAPASPGSSAPASTTAPTAS